MLNEDLVCENEADTSNFNFKKCSLEENLQKYIV